MALVYCFMYSETLASEIVQRFITVAFNKTLTLIGCISDPGVECWHKTLRCLQWRKCDLLEQQSVQG